MSEERELRESWFEQPPKMSVPPPSLAPPPPAPRTRPLLTGVLGAVIGVGAGAVGKYVVDAVAGHAVIESMRARIVVAALSAAMGILLSLAMMQSSRFITRVIFAPTVSMAIWFCVHVVMLYRHTATLPLLPMLAFMCLLGASVACIPPFRRAP